MRKAIITIIIVLVVIVIALGVYLIVSPKNSSSSTGTNTGSGQLGTLPAAQTSSTASQVYAAAPTSTELSIGTAEGTVSMNNFYLSNPPVGDDGVIIIKQNQNYVITYDPQTGEFWLAITGTPFATWQTAAEQDFLATLGISKTDACKLSASSGVVYSPGDPNDGKSFPLSFCTVNSAFQSQ